MVIPKTLPKKKGKIKEKGLLREKEVPVDYYHVYEDTKAVISSILGGEHPPINTPILREDKFAILAGYSEGALENLRRELEKRIDGLLENPGENLELIGLYTAVLKLAEKGEIEKAEEFLQGL